MKQTGDPHDIDLAELFPTVPADQRPDLRAFLDGYCELALQVFDRLERDRRAGIDLQQKNS